MEEVLSKETKEGPKKPQRMRYVNHVSMVPSVREGGKEWNLISWLNPSRN